MSGADSWEKQVAAIADNVRRRVLELTIEKKGCYLSQTLSSADILATLYAKVLRLGPSQAPMIPPRFPGVPGQAGAEYGFGAAYNGPQGDGFDRLLISPAHYAVAIYATLIEVGRMAPESLSLFNTDGSTLEMIGAEHSPGFELTTGSFGQAISQAGGIAMARKRRNEKGRVFVFMSDGELEEGQTWEAIQALAFHKIDNVVVVVDVNGQQVDGLTKEVMNIEPIDARIEGFGGIAVRVDGHNLGEIESAINNTSHDGRPLFVLAYTNTAQGVPLLDERKPHLHYVRFADETEEATYKQFLADWERRAS